jgi:hypothetical protein
MTKRRIESPSGFTTHLIASYNKGVRWRGIVSSFASAFGRVPETAPASGSGDQGAK